MILLSKQYWLTFLLFVSFFHIGAQAQNNVSKRLVNALKQTQHYYAQNHQDSCLYWSKVAIALAKKLRANAYEIKAKSYQAVIYGKTGHYTKALRLLRWNVQQIHAGSNLSTNAPPLAKPVGKALLLHYIGWIYSKQKKYTEAEKMYKKALLVNKKMHQVSTQNALKKLVREDFLLYHLGRVCYAQGKYKKAEKLYTKAFLVNKKMHELPSQNTLERSIKQDLLYYHLGRVYYKQGKYKKAEQMYKKVFLAYKKTSYASVHSAILYYRLGWTYYKQGKYKKAEKAHKEAIVNNKKTINAHLDLVTPFGQIQKPINEALLFYHLGWLYYKQRKYQFAEKAYTQAMLVEQTTTTTKAKLREEMDFFKKPVSKVLLLYRLGWTYYKQDKFIKAEQIFQKALSLNGEKLHHVGLSQTRSRPKTNINDAFLLHRLGWVYYKQGKHKQAEKNYKQALLVNKEVASIPELAQIPAYLKKPMNEDLLFYRLGLVYHKQGLYKASEQMHKKAIQASKKTHNFSRLAQVYNNLGIVYGEWQQNKKSLEYMIKALKLREAGYNKKELPYSYINLGSLEVRVNNIPKAILYYIKALRIARKQKHQRGQAISLQHLSRLALTYKKYTQAKQYAIEALSINKKINVKYGVAANLHMLGKISLKQQKINEAISYYNAALKIYKNIGYSISQGNLLISLTQVYIVKKQFDQAKKQANQVLSLAKRLKNIGLKAQALRKLSSVYYQTKQYREAFDIQKDYIVCKDSMLSTARLRAMETLKAIYEDEKKQDSIRLLNKENKIKDLNLAKQRDSIQLKQSKLTLLQKDKDLQAFLHKQAQQKNEAYLDFITFENEQLTQLFQAEEKNKKQKINLLSKDNQLKTSLLKNAQLQKRNLLITGGIITLLLIVAAGGLYVTQRQRVRLTKEKLRRQNIMSQFEHLKHQVNPHFLLNSLNALASLIQQDTQRAHEFTLQFSKLYLFVLELKDNLLVSLEDELKFCKAYLALQQVRFGQNLKVDYQINADQSQVSLPPLALQIALENAVKHNQITEQAPLHIRIFEDAKKLVVQNNLQKKAAHTVNSTHIGMKNIKERYKLIGKEQPEFIESTTDFTVKLPLSR